MAGGRRRRIITPELEELIRDYFLRGYTAIDIHRFLGQRGVIISYSHLRNKVMADLGLVKRAWNRPNRLRVAEAVLEATAQGAATTAATSAVTRVLHVDMGLNVLSRDVAAAQRALDPALVAARTTGRLHRRTYYSEGANYIWHIDGYDKLAPYGLPIHGCIDGFSRYVVWLELGTTNRRPEQTCKYFVSALRTECLPHTIRVDAGTENSNIKQAMRYLSHGLPRITPLQCVRVGSSNHNERIERFWGLLRLQTTNFWIAHFKQLMADGHMIAWDVIDRKVSYYVYSELVREDLNAMRAWHNDHRIRRQNVDIVCGKPLVLYTAPQDFGFRQCGRRPMAIKLNVVETQLTETIPFDRRMKAILDTMVQYLGLEYPPADITAADEMYIQLREDTHTLLD